MNKYTVDTWERTRQIIFLLAYAAVAEYVSPMPFIQSPFGKIVWFLILFFLAREGLRYHAKGEQVRSWVEDNKKRWAGLTAYTRYRISRFFRFIFMVYAVGWLVDGMTERCSGAFACGMLLPKMIAENLPEILRVTLYMAIGMSQIFLMMYMMAKSDLYNLIPPDAIKTRFKDIYGQDLAVKRMRENLNMLEKPEVVEAKGGYMPGGILLWGPPGTGKTMLAEAFAGETGKPYVFVGPGSFSNMFVGVPILKVKMLFRKLRKLALRYGGVVCFLDEIDSLGNRGGEVGGNGEEAVLEPPRKKQDQVVVSGGGMGGGALEVFLSEMQGLTKPKGLFNGVKKMLGFKPTPPPKYRILFIGATNLPQKLDQALLRPGRFDRKIKVDYPNAKGREATFQGYLDKIKHSISPELVAALARDNPRSTGAIIKDAINEALIKAINDGRDTVEFRDIRDAIIWKEMGEDEGRQPYEEDQRRVALHEAAHAVAAHHFRKNERISFASVVMRGRTLGVVSSIPTEERYTRTKSEMIGDMKVALASHWAEDFFYEGDISTGPSSDLQTATRLAKVMLFDAALAHHTGVFEQEDIPSETWVEEIDNFVNEVYNETADFLTARKDQVIAVADMLDKENTVDGEKIHALLERLDS